MFEFIGVVIAEFLGVIVMEYLFGGILRSLRWVGYRIFSMFTNEMDVPISELREKHDASIWPWVIIFGLLGGLTTLLLAL